MANAEKLGRMRDAAPAHVGDVKESVHALEVDKRTEVGEVLDLSGDLVAHSNGLEELLAALGALSLDDFTTGENDVLAVVVDLNDFEFVDVAHVFREILGRNDIDLGTGKKRFHTHVDHKSAFDG